MFDTDVSVILWLFSCTSVKEDESLKDFIKCVLVIFMYLVSCLYSLESIITFNFNLFQLF